MKRYKCTVCGMEINENNYFVNSAAFLNKNSSQNIIYCPFCGAPIEYIVDEDSYKAASSEKLDDQTLIILDHASKLEVFNSDFYCKASQIADKGNVKEVFKALSNIELMHARIHIKYAGINKLPSLREIDYSKCKGDKLLLKMAADRERHAVGFYGRYIDDISSQEVIRIIEALTKVEKEHIILTKGSI